MVSIVLKFVLISIVVFIFASFKLFVFDYSVKVNKIYQSCKKKVNYFYLKRKKIARFITPD